MANTCLKDFVVLSPLGLVARAPVPPVEPALRAGGYLLTRRLRLLLPSRKPGHAGRNLARYMPKGAMRRGDVLVRLDTGEVYAWLKRDRVDLARIGTLPEILAQAVPDTGAPLRVTSRTPEVAAALLAEVTAMEPKAARDLIAAGEPVVLKPRRANTLLVMAISTCGRLRCGDQTSPHTPTTILELAPAA